jgi:hypothetical protein
VDCDFIRVVLFRTEQSFSWEKVSIHVAIPGGCSLLCLTPPILSCLAGGAAGISRIDTSRSSDERLTGDSGRESDTSEGGGVKGYSISDISSSWGS